LAAVAARHKELEELGVQVISISIDSIYVHKVWEEQELSLMVEGGIPWPMASDTAGNIGRVYSVYDEETGVEMRGQFLIDPDGVIQAIEILTPPVGRNLDETIRQIKAFQLVRETEGKEATPAGWQPGKVTLKPGPDLVGKVWKEWKPES